MNLFTSSILAVAIATTSSTAVDAYDGPVSWSISDFVKQAKDLKFVQKGEEKKSVHPQFIRKHDDDEDEKKSSGEDNENEDKDRSSDNEGKSKIEGICRDPDNDLDKKYCDELCKICDPDEVLCCHCLGCTDSDDAAGTTTNDQQSFLRANNPAEISCITTHQDLAVLYDYFQDENRDGVFLGCGL